MVILVLLVSVILLEYHDFQASKNIIFLIGKSSERNQITHTYFNSGKCPYIDTLMNISLFSLCKEKVKK